MIYLFDKEKQLNKALPLNHFSSAHQVKIINGAYTVDLVTPLKFTKRGTVYNHKKAFDKSDFVGHFDENNRFQLYRITNVKVDNNTVNTIGVHIFFDEAKAKTIIHDRRWRDSELRPIADFALGEIGWNLLECDVTDRYNFNIFRGSILDFRKDAIETYKVEMDYEIGFDGQKITSKGVRIKNRLGEETGERFAYGSNVLKITAEQDRSEVYTAVIGRGRGEESGDGYGQRIEFENVVWSTSNGDPVDKPAGQNYVELPAATEEYGYYEDGAVQPRIAVIEFDDIEDENLLITESWEWLLQNSLPKAVFSSDVFTLGNYNLGDSIGIIYKDAGIIKKARVQKIDINLQDNRKTSFELGDYKHFKPDTFGKVRGELKKQQRKTSEMITRLKNMFDEDFNRVEQEMNDEFNNAVAEAEAKVQASEARMNDIISTNRTEIMQEVETSKQEAIQKAEQNAEAKKQEVQSNLDSFKDVHQKMYDDVTADIIDINEFIGPQTEPLTAMLNNLEMTWQNKLDDVDTWHYNMLRGTRFDEDYWFGYSMEPASDGNLNYFEFEPSRNDTMIPYIESTQEIVFEKGETYRLSFDFQTYAVREINYIWLIATENETEHSNRSIWHPNNHNDGTHLFTSWGSEFNRYWLEFTMPHTMRAYVRLAVNLNENGGYGRRPFKFALPYLTTTKNTRWLYHQLDSYQNIEEITRRITQLEDGREEFISRTEYDNRTGEIDGTIRQIKETVDESKSIISNHEDFITTNGSAMLQTVDEVSSKVWMDDIVNPNMLRYTGIADVNHRVKWGQLFVNSTGSSYVDWFHVRNTDSHTYIAVRSTEFSIVEGEVYTASFEAWENGDDSKNTSGDMGYTFITSEGNTSISSQGLGKSRKRIGSINGADIYKYVFTFTAPYTVDNARLLVGTRTNGAGLDASFRFKAPKVEKGSRATAFHTSFSTFQQTVDEMSLTVQDINSNSITESEVFVGTSGVQIGSTYIGDEQFASIFSVSPRTIDVVTEKMRITADMAVAGDIESISMSAVRAEFADLFAAQVRANVIDVDYITGLTAEFEYLYTLNANIERLVSQIVFTDAVHAKSLDAVHANISSIRSNILTSDVILSKHINSSNALIDKIFSSDAYIDRLTSKTAFIRDIQAIEVTLNQLNVNTIMDEAGKINGGISIRRPDGAYVVNNGMLRNEYVVSAYSPEFMSQTHQGLDAYFSSGSWWVTNHKVKNDLGGDLRFNAYQFIHSARYLEVEIGLRRHESTVQLKIDSFGGDYSFNDYQGFFQKDDDSTVYTTMKVDLGVPDFRRKAFYLKVTPAGTPVNNGRIWFRILRVVQTDF